MAQKINEGITGAEAATLIYENDARNEDLALTANKVLGVDNLLKNPFFKDTLNPWYKNEDTFIFDIEEGYAHVNTGSATNTGLVQPLTFEAIEYLVEIRVKKNNANPTTIQFFSFPVANVAQIVLDGTDWKTYRTKLKIESAGAKSFVCKIVGVNSDIYIDYILFSAAEGSLPSTLADINTQVNQNTENIGLNNIIKNYDFSQGLLEWNRNEATLALSTQDGHAKVDATNGVDPAMYQNPVEFKKGAYQFAVKYKKLSAGTASFRLGTPYDSNKIQVQSVAGDDWEVFSFDVEFTNDGSGLFMFAPSPGSVWLVAEMKAQTTADGSLAADVADLKKR